MKAQRLASYLCNKEGGRSDGRIGDKRQDIAHISDLIFKESRGLRSKSSRRAFLSWQTKTIKELYLNGEKRAASKKPRRKK